MKNILLPLSLSLLTAYAQNTSTITIPATNGSIPTGGQNGCAPGYYPGTDTVLYTLPYTYPQVLSIIGNYTNLTWSRSPPNSVTSNSTSWIPGTARFYTLVGATIIETITEYSKPANDTGPYIEIHTLAPFTTAAAKISLYSDYDAQNWTSVCDGKATTTNFTINFCATNASAAAALLHSIHLRDVQTVGTFLGVQNFTTCKALGSNAMTPNTTSPTMAGGNETGSGGAAGLTANGAVSGFDGSKVTVLSSGFLVVLGLMLV